jgi:cystathionine beta-lyase
VRSDACPGDPHRPTSTPIYQTATFAQESAFELGRYDYSRSGNPTRAVLERELARLELGRRGLAFASGMAALSTLARLVPAGGTLVAGDDLYGGTYRLLEEVLGRAGVRVRFVDVTDGAAVERELARGADLLLVETPTNPLQRVADVRGLAALARARGTLFAVDNTHLSPWLQNPLELGADVVVHSATKHLGGHGDLTAGALVVRDEALGERLAFLQNAEGNALAPFEAWLLLRGLKTLGLRVERAVRNAEQVARFLAAAPLVTRVHYVGLASHPGHALHARQARGPGSVVAFETGSVELSRRVVERLELFTIAVSFGSVASQATLPCRMSHKSIPAGVRAERRLPEDLVRLSIGIEDAQDLVDDLSAAFASAAATPEGDERGLARSPDARPTREPGPGFPPGLASSAREVRS